MVFIWTITGVIDHSIFDTKRIKMGKIWHVPENIPTYLSWSTGFDQNTVEVHTQYALMTFTKLVRAHLRGEHGWTPQLTTWPPTWPSSRSCHCCQCCQEAMWWRISLDRIVEQQQRSQIFKRSAHVSLRIGPPHLFFWSKKNGKSIIVHVSRTNLSNTKRQI